MLASFQKGRKKSGGWAAPTTIGDCTALPTGRNGMKVNGTKRWILILKLVMNIRGVVGDLIKDACMDELVFVGSPLTTRQLGNTSVRPLTPTLALA